ncbi:hypothetical protein CALVIDRAFT_567699 [Calocera viscosa TUFC12733]|uniref:Large ribosomal subunit protein bL33m n=1 Tax=Calocera viscosa (strain TUFC12733) TaxID=1330018 RepID=A0A167HYX4_CALVF|nr:hypothetical protein CALVIDRAFT_567699 [Calocera viscosa TUFC12733]
MAKAKTRSILVKLASTAETGYFFVRSRPRTSGKLSQIKYDPKAKRHVLFIEKKLK